MENNVRVSTLHSLTPLISETELSRHYNFRGSYFSLVLDLVTLAHVHIVFFNSTTDSTLYTRY